MIQCLSPDEIFSHWKGPPRKQEMLGSMKLQLLKVCNDILPHIEEKYPVFRLYVDFAEKEQSAKLSGLLTREKLRGMMEQRNRFADDALFQVRAEFVGRSFSFVGKDDLTRMSVMYTNNLSKVLFDHRGRAWVASELVILQLENRKFKSAVENIFGA